MSNDDDSLDDSNIQLLLCRPVGSYPLAPAEKNALNNNSMHDDDAAAFFISTADEQRPPKKNGNGDIIRNSPTSKTSSSSRTTAAGTINTIKKQRQEDIPIKGMPTKSDSTRRWQTRRRNARTIAKKARFRLFAEWLIETYGMSFLTSTSTTSTSSDSDERRRRRGYIIDVAGGRGRMALELAIDRGIPCIVVDPVPVTFSVHTTRRIVNKAKDAIMSSNTSTSSTTATLDVIAVSGQAAAASDDDNHPMSTIITTDTTTTTQNNSDGNNQKQKPFILLNDQEFHRMDAHVLQHTKHYMQNVVGFAYHQCLFNDDYIQQRPDVWHNASMVIGMHPDEATECIVDQALRSNKAFAVVPCCVFPNLFPWRTIATTTTVTTSVPSLAAAAASVDDDDHAIMQQQQQQQQPEVAATTTTTTPVRTLDQFILYLCAKDARIQTHILDDMEGSNTVVYMKV